MAKKNKMYIYVLKFSRLRPTYRYY